VRLQVALLPGPGPAPNSVALLVQSSKCAVAAVHCNACYQGFSLCSWHVPLSSVPLPPPADLLWACPQEQQPSTAAEWTAGSSSSYMKRFQNSHMHRIIQCTHITCNVVLSACQMLQLLASRPVRLHCGKPSLPAHDYITLRYMLHPARSVHPIRSQQEAHWDYKDCAGKGSRAVGSMSRCHLLQFVMVL
jgi:hypothetical protein